MDATTFIKTTSSLVFFAPKAILVVLVLCFCMLESNPRRHASSLTLSPSQAVFPILKFRFETGILMW